MFLWKLDIKNNIYEKGAKWDNLDAKRPILRKSKGRRNFPLFLNI